MCQQVIHHACVTVDIDVVYSVGSSIGTTTIIVAVVIIAVLVVVTITLAVTMLVIICKRSKSSKYDHVYVNGWL